jgi:hypothetical protein
MIGKWVTNYADGKQFYVNTCILLVMIVKKWPIRFPMAVAGGGGEVKENKFNISASY